LANECGRGLPQHTSPPHTLNVLPRTEASERRCRALDLTYNTMGKKSREKKAKQLERDRKREGEGNPGASTSRVKEVPDHNNTPAADAKSSTDDTRDEPASTTVRSSDSTSAVGERLRAFCESCMERLGDEIDTWVHGEFSSNIAPVKAAAERGDAKAQHAIGFMMLSGFIPDDGDRWMHKAEGQGYGDAFLALGVMFVGVIVHGRSPQGQEEAYNNAAKTYLTKSAVEQHSADAQYILAMLDCFQHGCSRSKPDMLKTARWFRKAAHQGLAEAQWELGEWFRRGVFCDVHVPFARQYIRRAARQGHAEAIDRLKELCSCVYCGAAAAP
jgi:hypothetical protein